MKNEPSGNRNKGEATGAFLCRRKARSAETGHDEELVAPTWIGAGGENWDILDFTKAIERDVGAMETWLARTVEGEEDHLEGAVYSPILRKP